MVAAGITNRLHNDQRGSRMADTFEVYKDQRGEYRFRLKAGNGEIVATGESYETKAGVKASRRSSAPRQAPRPTTRPTDRQSRPGTRSAGAVLYP